MGTRTQLHELLCGIHGDHKVYFQPPPDQSLGTKYIVYSRARPKGKHADNKRYLNWDQYTVTLVDPNPDCPLRSQLDELPYCTFDRQFNSANLTHFVYTLFY